MKNNLLISIFLLLFLIPVHARKSAETGGGEGSSAACSSKEPTRLSRAETLKIVMESNPGIQAMGHTAQAAEKLSRAAVLARFGKLEGVWSYSRIQDSQILRPMSRELLAGGMSEMPFDKNQTHYGLKYSIPVYLGGKLQESIKIARLESDKKAALLNGTKWQIRFNVTSLYSAVQTLDQVLVALDDQIASLEKMKTRLDIMVQAGKRPRIDRLKVVEELEGARARKADIASQRRKAGATLLALMGRDPIGRFDADPLPRIIPECTLTSEELHESLAQCSEIRRAKIEYAQSKSKVGIAFSDFIPSIFVSGNYMQNDAPSRDDPMETWNVTVGVSIPILSGGSRFENMGAAREMKWAAEQMLKKAQLKVSADLEEALAAFAASKAQLKAAGARVAAGTEAARIEQIRYDTGAGTIEDLLRARAREESAKAAFAAAVSSVITHGERINSIVEREAVK